MGHLDILLLAYYLGLILFSLLGLTMMGISRKHREILISEKRVVRLLMRRRR